MYFLKIVNFSNDSFPYTLHEKPYFPSPRISWKAQKDQVNIIFPSTFWLKKDRIFHHRKVQNKNFLVTSKYHISINLLTRKKTVFPTTEKFKTRTFQLSVNIIFSINFLTQKEAVFTITEKFKTRTFQLSANIIFT